MAGYDFSESLGISFYWWGTGTSPEIQVDLILKTPTGNFVAAFPDGPAEWRWVYLEWSDFKEVAIDGTRPDKSQITGILWTVHTDGVRRVDRISRWRNALLPGLFVSRQSDSTDLSGTIVARQPGSTELEGMLVIRNTESRSLDAGLDIRLPFRRLKAGFKVAQDSEALAAGFMLKTSESEDLKAGFLALHNIDVFAILFVGEDYESYTEVDGVVE